MTPIARTIICACGHPIAVRRVSTTCEGARFISGVCPRTASLIIRRIHPIRTGAACADTDMPMADRLSARSPTSNVSDSPGASASGAFA